MHDIDNLTICKHLVVGYLVVYMPTHPHANSGGWVYLHRIIMEHKLNRILESGEIVHHIDHDKLNNDETNLRLTTHGEHAKEHQSFIPSVICKICKNEFKPHGMRQQYCSHKCGNKAQEKIQWPSLKELETMLLTKPMVQVAEELGVSDNGVKKHMKKEYNKISLENSLPKLVADKD